MRHFSFEMDPEGIGILKMDTPGQKVNTLSLSTLNDFEDFLTAVEEKKELRGIVLISGKEDSFIAGADITEFLKLKSPEEATTLSRKAQTLLDRVEHLRVPIVAAIHGACLGGGSEVALACHYRVASDDPKTVVGQPEVQIGVLPAAAGTQRLPRLVGLRHGLDLILTGRHLKSKKAKRIGYVDEVVPKEILFDVAKKAALDLFGGRLRRTRRRAFDLSSLIFEKNPIGRGLLFSRAEKEVLKRTHGHYPAPLRALEAIRTGITSPDKGLQCEAQFFGELTFSGATRALINLFFDIQEVKKQSSLSKISSRLRAREINHIGIVGAGFMGSAIAAAAAEADISVRLKDKDYAALGKGLKSCHDYFTERQRRGSIDALTKQRILDRISGTCDNRGFGRADLIIEAVAEDLALKRLVFQEMEHQVPSDCTLASNTSSLPITEIARSLERPENCIGMHFFSPVHKMPLLEIVTTKASSDQALKRAIEFGQRIGKTMIIVNDGVGFYTSRILAPYMNEVGYVLMEGVPIEAIDTAMVEFGFHVGPITLLDEVGIDVAVKVSEIMHRAFGNRLLPPESISRLAQSGRLGRKNKFGFYAYQGKKRVNATVYDLFPLGRNLKPIPFEEIQQRLSLAMVNEAALCLEEGILRHPRDGDVGAVLGLGFPPFRGGPFRYIDSIGAQTIAAEIEKLASRFPPRFKPSQLLLDMARKGETFYGN